MKTKISKKLVSIITIILVVAMTVAGCSKGKEGKEETVVATLGDEKISLKEANFYARFSQATYEATYLSYFGDEMWSTDLYGDGTTLEDSTKASVMDYLKQIHIMASHAKEYEVELTDEEIADLQTQAASLMESWEEALINITGATEEYVVELFKVSAIANKVYEAAVADIDTEVTDEEAAQKLISYVFLPTTGEFDAEGNTIELTEEEKIAVKNKAQGIVDEARTTGDFETSVTNAEFTAYSASYGTDSAEIDPDVKVAADALEEGGIADVIETKNGYYVVKLASAFDEQATATKKEEIVAERQSEAFKKIFDEWAAEVEFVIDEEVWATVTFDEPVIPVEETTDGTTEGTTDGTTEETTEETTDDTTGVTTEEATDGSTEEPAVE